MIKLGQDYLPARPGTATGVTLGLATGDLAKVAVDGKKDDENTDEEKPGSGGAAGGPTFPAIPLGSMKDMSTPLAIEPPPVALIELAFVQSLDLIPVEAIARAFIL